MLLTRISKGHPPILRRMAQLSAQTAAIRRGSLALLSLQQHRALHRHFWDSNVWCSHFDPAYQSYHKRRQQRAHAAFRESIRRRSKWLMPMPWKGSFGNRLASHSSKSFKEWAKFRDELHKDIKKKIEDDYELSPGEKRWKKQMEQMQRQVETDPYQAVFGRPFKPFWSPLTEEAGENTNNTKAPQDRGLRREDTGTNVKSASKKDKETSQVAADSSPPHIKMERDPKTGYYIESSSLSYSSHKVPGKPPVVEASAQSWNSSSNRVQRFEYDPISNRMIPRGDNATKAPQATRLGRSQSSSDPTGTTINDAVGHTNFKETLHPNKARPSDDVDTLTADSLRSSIQAKRKQVKENPASEQSTGKFTIAQDFDDEFAEVQKRLRDSDMRRSDLQRRVWAQTPNEHTEGRLHKTTARLNQLREEHDNIGRIATQLHQHANKIDKKIHRVAANPEEYTSAEIADIIGRGRDQMRQLQKEQARLESSIAGMSAELDKQTAAVAEIERPHGYHHDIDPQTAARMQEAVRTLDVYSTAPIGLQTSFEAESDGALEHEIANRETEAVQYDDGYSNEPVGLQQAYEREREQVTKQSRPSLSDELDENVATDEVYDDGYSNKPFGMQQTYAQERKEVEKQSRPSLSDELDENVATDEVYDDGYSNKPLGMQQTFAQERTEVAQNKRPSLSDELDESIPTHEVYDDGYSDKPIGLQQAFARERKEVSQKTRPSLSDELDESIPTHEIFDDGYSTKPVGMQETFANEWKDVKQNSRPSLSEELVEAQTDTHIGHNWSISQHESGPHKGDIFYEVPAETSDVEASLEKELSQYDDFAATERESAGKTAELTLEEELKTSSCGDQLAPKDVRSLYNDNIEAQTPALVHLKGTDQRSRAAHTIMQQEIDRVKDAARLHEERDASDRAIPAKGQPVKDGVADTSSQAMSYAEGDLCARAVDYANSDRWYKQDKSLRATSPFTHGDELAAEIKKIATENGLLDEAKAVTEVPAGDALSSITASVDSAGPIQWASPPSYKILAYDPGSDTISTVTTTSRFSENESPLSVAKAMSQVYEPARFVSHFATLQNEGYQAVHASDNLLVFRQVHQPAVAEAEVTIPSSKSEQEKPSEVATPVNPIDGMGRPHVDAATGNYASPTGFVNYDPIFPPEPPSKEESSSATVSRGPNIGEQSSSDGTKPTGRPTTVADGIYYRHYPPVRRQEAVFSGARRHKQHQNNHHRKRPSWKRRVRFVLSVAATSAALVYAMGVGARVMHKERMERELEVAAAREGYERGALRSRGREGP